MPHLDIEFFAIGAFALGLVHGSWLIFLREPVRRAICNWRIKRFFATPAPEGCSVQAEFDAWGRVTRWHVVPCADFDTASDFWGDQ